MRMYDYFLSFLDSIAQFWLAIPLPWRIPIGLIAILLVLFKILWPISSFLIRLIISILLFLVNGLFGILLWLEYQITSLFRRLFSSPLPGTHLVSDFVEGLNERIIEGRKSVKLGYKPLKVKFRRILLISILPIFLWYSPVFIQNSDFKNIVENGFTQWQKAESFLLKSGNERIILPEELPELKIPDSIKSTSDIFGSLTSEDETPEPTSTPNGVIRPNATSSVTAQATVNQNAFVRSGPSPNYDDIDSKRAETIISIVGYNNDREVIWYKLEDGGWIYGELISNLSNDVPYMKE